MNTDSPKGVLIVFTIFALCGMMPSSNAGELGERFVDIYGGYSTTQGDIIEGEYQYVSILGSSSRESFRSHYGEDDGSVYGARLGWWMDTVPWLGLALDGSYFTVKPDDVDLDMNVFVLTPMLMARYPFMISDDYPHGRLQPYLALGPAFAWVDTSFTFYDGSSTTDFDDFASGIGPDFRVGSTFMLFRQWGVFVEYRYTHIKVKSDIGDDWVFLGGQITGMETTLSTQYIQGGITFRF